LPEKSSSSTREEQPVLHVSQINKVKNLTSFKAYEDKINQKMIKDM
jgi:hypothetical protein